MMSGSALLARSVFTSDGTTRGQGIIRVVILVIVVVVATFFRHSHFLEDS